MKTAVEWLIEQIESCKITMYNDGDRKKLISLVDNNLIEQAKEMENKMLRKAYDQGIDDSYDVGFSSKDDDNFNEFIKKL
jgi:hypothetical protein